MKELLDRISKTSWRTTISGAVAVFGGFVLMFPQHFNSFWIDVAKFLTLGGFASACATARDSAASTQAHQDEHAQIEAVEEKVEPVKQANRIEKTGEDTNIRVAEIEKKIIPSIAEAEAAKLGHDGCCK